MAGEQLVGLLVWVAIIWFVLHRASRRKRSPAPPSKPNSPAAATGSPARATVSRTPPPYRNDQRSQPGGTRKNPASSTGYTPSGSNHGTSGQDDGGYYVMYNAMHYGSSHDTSHGSSHHDSGHHDTSHHDTSYYDTSYYDSVHH
jgi:hypothetical protein